MCVCVCVYACIGGLMDLYDRNFLRNGFYFCLPNPPPNSVHATKRQRKLCMIIK